MEEAYVNAVLQNRELQQQNKLLIEILDEISTYFDTRNAADEMRVLARTAIQYIQGNKT